jgi:pyruvate/2-oxoglutarate dehydrogenase complex dihydrolipoamide acyltransferase (E2) component
MKRELAAMTLEEPTSCLEAGARSPPPRAANDDLPETVTPQRPPVLRCAVCASWASISAGALSDERGRITEDDVRNLSAKPGRGRRQGDQGSRRLAHPIRRVRRQCREKMSRMRQTIARNMLASYTTIPQLTNFDDVDLTEMERIRKESANDYSTKGVKLTTMPFLVKACAVALKHHPIVNGSVSEEGDEIIYKEYVNIGIAVDTERGLIVPVLRDADRKNIPQIAKELVKLPRRPAAARGA